MSFFVLETENVGTDEQFVKFLKCVFRDYITGSKVGFFNEESVALRSSK